MANTTKVNSERNILKETVELLINDENEFDKTVNNNSIKKSFKLKS